MTRIGSDHGTLPQRTYERLRDLIVRGRIPSGARMVESELAERFGISRTPVRDALLMLLHDRFLAPLSGGRRTELAVAGFSAEDVKELWGIIGALECYAIGNVATLSKARRVQTAADLDTLNLQLREAATQRPRNPDLLFELQAAFHLRFIDEVAGPHLRSLYDGLRPQVQRYEWVYGTRAEADYVMSTSEHLRIISAVRDGDPVTARAAITSHWEKAAARTAAIIEGLEPSSAAQTAAGKRGIAGAA